MGRIESEHFLVQPPRPKQPRLSRAKPPKPLPRTRALPRRSSAIDCRPHVDWVLENHGCCLAGKVSARTGRPHVCQGPLDPHHTPTRGAGGGDNDVIPICRGGHSLIDSPKHSEASVQAEYGVAFRLLAKRLWDVSPEAARYRLQQAHEGERV